MLPRMTIDSSQYRALLLARRQQLTRIDSGSTSDRTVELDQSRVGRLSRMDALQGQAMSVAAKHRRQSELQRIAAALRRIDDDEYGYCEQCGGRIPAGRLEIDPAAELCVECAARAERIPPGAR